MAGAPTVASVICPLHRRDVWRDEISLCQEVRIKKKKDENKANDDPFSDDYAWIDVLG
jgi:hypothetical protein